MSFYKERKDAKLEIAKLLDKEIADEIIVYEVGRHYSVSDAFITKYIQFLKKASVVKYRKYVEQHANG